MIEEKIQGNAVRERIVGAAQAEFLVYGFERSSLRRIAKAAGMTTGAIYGYFPGKEKLFDAVVSTAANELLTLCEQSQEEFYRQPKDKRSFSHMLEFDKMVVTRAAALMYENREAFLLVTGSAAAGTSWDDYARRLVDIEIAETNRYLGRRHSEAGEQVKTVPDMLMRVLTESYFHSLFEIFRREPDREAAIPNMHGLVEFYHRGYEVLFAAGTSND